MSTLTFAALARAQTESVEAFYKGKTITILVGFAPGGSYDFYPRVFARHMGKYIPGHPTMVVQSMIAFSMMPLASAVAINFSAPIFATVASIIFLHEKVGVVRWSAILVGFLGVLIVTSPGSDTFTVGALFALANAIMT